MRNGNGSAYYLPQSRFLECPCIKRCWYVYVVFKYVVLLPASIYIITINNNTRGYASVLTFSKVHVLIMIQNLSVYRNRYTIGKKQYFWNGNLPDKIDIHLLYMCMKLNRRQMIRNLTIIKVAFSFQINNFHKNIV